MDVSRMSYYAPRDRVFVNTRRRSTIVSPIKTQNFLEFNKNSLRQNFKQTNTNSLMSESNYLLGSSIVNVNFVNNVSNPIRGYETYKALPSNNFYQRTSLDSYKADSLPNTVANQENIFPFKNYNYSKSNSESLNPPTRSNLNLQDTIITNLSSSSPPFKSRQISGPILTRNYLESSPSNTIGQLSQNLSGLNLNESICSNKKPQDLKTLERKNRLSEYLDTVKKEPYKKDTRLKKVKITIGRPTHEYVAKYPDPVEKELESWHNSHNSTLKWERVKYGLYSVAGSVVHLRKVNGGLYVEGHGFKRFKGQMTILRFVEEKESQLLREKT